MATDEQKAGCFIWGLPTHIQRALISNSHLGFVEVVDKARQLEKLDGKGMGESSKKPKIEPQSSKQSGSIVSLTQQVGTGPKRSRMSSMQGAALEGQSVTSPM